MGEISLSLYDICILWIVSDHICIEDTDHPAQI